MKHSNRKISKRNNLSSEAAGPVKIDCAFDELVPIGKVKPYPRNPVVHPEKQIARLAKIIAGTGWRNPIVISRRSGYVVKGHGRLAAAARLGMDAVPVDWQDYATDEEEKADRIADNKIAELAEDNLEALLAEMTDINLAGADLDMLGMDESELESLLSQIEGGGNGEVDAEPQIDKAEELRAKWGVETGQLWQLGDHRILCGDSTKAEDVERVLAGDKPLLMVPDPPYGVEYDPTWRDGYGGEFGDSKAINRGKVTNDDRADWREAWALFPGDVAYVWHGERQLVDMGGQLHEAGLQTRNLIVWAKPSLTFGRGHYHSQHETCWYAVKNGKVGHWAGGCKQTTLWEIAGMNPAGRGHADTSDGKTGHATQKPVECMARPIRNHDSEFVYDPFLGSGTTLIACEQLGRKCRAIEISPGYVAVAIQRWADATGGTPKLLA
jgi:DNA modification methylase